MSFSSNERLERNIILDVLLRNRGIQGDEATQVFLNPDYGRDVHDPYLYNDMHRVVERIKRATQDSEQIVVWGDYDCDGIPGAVTLYDFFKKIEYTNVRVYIPHRHNEGYGLNIKAIEQLAHDGVTLIITVDSGITDLEQVAFANKRGIDVIITDHHLPHAELPQAYAILNAKRADNTYPDPWLCGAGVAFKLVQALVRDPAFSVSPGWEKWLLDVVGIATIADMVPLTGENRALAHFGLRVLRQTRRPGLLHLLRKARIAPADIKEDTVGFDIGPRINAASRLDVPMRGFELLSTTDMREGGVLADHLESLNQKRKRLVQDALAHSEQLEIGDDPVVVVGSEAWPVGIVGLIAGRLVERFERPVFVWGLGNDPAEAKGSCRSDGTVNLVSLMTATSPDTFTAFGGHEGAGGFTLARYMVDTLAERLAVAHGLVARSTPREGPTVQIDGELAIAEIDEELMRLIDRLGPFGVDNPRPHFVFKNVVSVHREVFGKTGKHLKIIARAGGRLITCIKFFDGDMPLAPALSFIGAPEHSTFAGRRELRIRIHSFL